MIKFSIIIPTYKRVDLLNRAMTSVKNQIYKNYEVIVCSDGYSEDDKSCVLNMNDNRFIYDFVEKTKIQNYGGVQRNAMISKCTGNYIIWLDDDNVIEKDYLLFAKKIIYYNNYGMLIFKIIHNISGVIPTKKDIILGDIDTLNVMIRKNIAKKITWGSYYDSDFYAIKEAQEHCLKNNYKVLFFQKIIGTHN